MTVGFINLHRYLVYLNSFLIPIIYHTDNWYYLTRKDGCHRHSQSDSLVEVWLMLLKMCQENNELLSLVKISAFDCLQRKYE